MIQKRGLRKQKGFGIIEAFVIIAVVAIIATAAVAIYKASKGQKAGVDASINMKKLDSHYKADPEVGATLESSDLNRGQGAYGSLSNAYAIENYIAVPAGSAPPEGYTLANNVTYVSSLPCETCAASVTISTTESHSYTAATSPDGKPLVSGGGYNATLAYQKNSDLAILQSDVLNWVSDGIGNFSLIDTNSIQATNSINLATNDSLSVGVKLNNAYGVIDEPDTVVLLFLGLANLYLTNAVRDAVIRRRMQRGKVR